MDRLFGLEQTKNILKFIHDKKFNVDNFGWYFYRLKAKYKKSEYINKLIDKDTIIEEKEKTVFTLERLLACDDKVYISLYGNRVDEKEFNNTISYLKTTNNIDHIKKYYLHILKNVLAVNCLLICASDFWINMEK